MTVQSRRFRCSQKTEYSVIRWLHDEEHFPKDQEIIKKYKQYPTLYLDEMKPYDWRCRIMWSKEEYPSLFLQMWLIEHDPENIYLTDDEWLERDQVLKDLKKFNAIYGIPDPLLEREIRKTKESMSGFQKELKQTYNKQNRAEGQREKHNAVYS